LLINFPTPLDLLPLHWLMFSYFASVFFYLPFYFVHDEVYSGIHVFMFFLSGDTKAIHINNNVNDMAKFVD